MRKGHIKGKKNSGETVSHLPNEIVQMDGRRGWRRNSKKKKIAEHYKEVVESHKGPHSETLRKVFKNLDNNQQAAF